MFLWNFKRIYRKYFVIGDGKTNQQKIKLFFYSLFIGLLTALIIVTIFAINPFIPLINGIKSIFQTNQKTTSFVTTMVVLGLAGIAVGVGFKTGLFNIGVSGQMLTGGITAGVIALHLGSSVPNGIGQILVIFISVMVGGMVAAISGFLKSFFNIHEVVSTILINWIAFFLMKWILDPNTSTLLNESMIQTREIGSNYLLRINDSPFWPSLIIFLVTACLLWIIIYKTKYGMILKMTGFNPEGAKFLGINTKLATIGSLTLSGAIAGLLGAVLYFGVQTNFLVPKADVIPIEGFNGIAIAIIAYSNPIIIVIVSAFFAIIQMGIINTSGVISTTFIPLVLGIIMFTSAINSSFNRLNWGKFFRILFYSRKFNKIYENYKLNQEKIHQEFYDKYNFLSKNNDQINFASIKVKIIKEHHQQLQKLKLDYFQTKKEILSRKKGE